ncbi:MAG: YeeE/YedE family protein [Pseudomonadota bacterium]
MIGAVPLDWLYGLLGGLMIGGAAALYLLAGDRIMGASGILGRALDPTTPTSERAERLAFLAGLIAVPAGLALLTNPQTNATSNPVLLIAAGLLVGFGTRLGNGCTSGHGVCGISRLSIRGIAATLVYLVVGALTMLALPNA